MTNASNNRQPAWVAPFLEALRAGKTVTEAACALGIDPTGAFHRRRSDPAFAAAWAAIRAFDAPEEKPRPYGVAKLDRFLTELAASSNVSAAAAVAGVSAGKIYKLRREDPEFARRWYAALAEGYDNLEMELLGRLRSGGLGGDAGEKDKGRFDTATALRCLTAHRESVAREKGRRTLAEEVTTMASINAKIDSLRLAGRAGKAAIRQARSAKARASKAAAGKARSAAARATAKGSGHDR